MTRVALCSAIAVLAVLACGRGVNAETVHVQTVTPKVNVPTPTGGGTSKNSIHIESFSFGSQQTSSAGTGGGGGTGKVDVSGFNLGSGKRQHKPITLNGKTDPALIRQYQLNTNGQ